MQFQTGSTPPEALVPPQLADALRRYRNHPAICDHQHHLTYAQLEGFVRRLEALMGRAGPVAIFGVPDAMLGAAGVAAVILGRPFVHLDPAMPQTVLRNIIDELHITDILTCQPPRAGQLPPGCRIIAATDCLGDVDPQAPALIPAQVAPQDAIYLVATSGTTGRPKCIPVTHDAANLSYAWRDAYTPYAPGMTVAIYIFAIWEMFRPLRNGARLCFPALNDLMSPQALGAFLTRHAVDEMLFTPSFFRKTLATIDAEAGARLPLRRVVLNGEVVGHDLIALARERLPGAELWNLYSICETHDVSMTRLTGNEDPTAPNSVGVAMPHLRAVVLDDADRPCPSGQPGRLHFQGDRMLGPGYVNRPEETAQRFRNLMLEGRPARLYDTGDQGVVSETGQILVQGRVAHMLKLRGHSIQTRELTETLAGHMQFDQAIPWVQQTEAQGQVLVLYYTADAAQRARNADQWGIDTGWRRMPRALAVALQQMLPRYCIPAFLALLDEIPLNPVSGKCDLKALPPVPQAELHLDDDAGDEATLPPAQRLAAQVLRCPASALDPALSFQDQGGDSLGCVDLLMLLEAAYGRPVDFDWALGLPLQRLHDLLTEDAGAAPGAEALDRPGILLTGATGFLGGHVLARAARVLPEGQVIYCLARAREAEPAARLAAKAAALGIPPGRVVAVPGKIDAPRFGLDDASWQALARQVGAVIHCAATVNLAVAPDQMLAWSRQGIEAVLEFCREAGAPLAFSSSTSIFPDQGGPHPEGPTVPFAGISGYGAAKIAAEEAILASGLPALILRLPSLYDRAAPNPADIYEAVLAACCATRTVPEAMEFPMTDVRAAARLMVTQAVTGVTGCCNLIGDHAVTEAQAGPGFRRLPITEWLAQAPLAAGPQRLLAGHPSILRADADFANDRAKAIWQQAGLGPYAAICDPDGLIAQRLAPAREMATTESRR